MKWLRGVTSLSPILPRRCINKRAMADRAELLLFGEENPNLRPHIRSLIIRSRTNPYLSLLKENAGQALLRSIINLPPAERRQIPRFSTIDELNESTDGGKDHVGVQFALNCLLSIAQYIE